jgi:hypothetical protein
MDLSLPRNFGIRMVVLAELKNVACCDDDTLDLIEARIEELEEM